MCIEKSNTEMAMNKDEQNIEHFLIQELPLGDQTIALDFVKYLRESKMEVIRDNGYWKDKIYYVVKFNGECICFIAINDPDEKENRWTVWSDDVDSNCLEFFPIDSELQKSAKKYIDFCGNCDSCGGGKHKIIFGNEFDNVCCCTFRFDNPDVYALKFMKKIFTIIKDKRGF